MYFKYLFQVSDHCPRADILFIMLPILENMPPSRPIASAIRPIFYPPLFTLVWDCWWDGKDQEEWDGADDDEETQVCGDEFEEEELTQVFGEEELTHELDGEELNHEFPCLGEEENQVFPPCLGDEELNQVFGEDELTHEFPCLGEEENQELPWLGELQIEVWPGDELEDQENPLFPPLCGAEPKKEAPLNWSSESLSLSDPESP